MNYTLTQAIDRAKDLSGIIKAARAHEADCAADHEAKKNIAEIAGEAHEKAVSACIALELERDQLADHVAALVRKTGEPLELDTQEPLAVLPDATPESSIAAPNKFDTFGVLNANDPEDDAFMRRAEERMNGAYDEATR